MVWCCSMAPWISSIFGGRLVLYQEATNRHLRGMIAGERAWIAAAVAELTESDFKDEYEVDPTPPELDFDNGNDDQPFLDTEQ